MRLVYLSFPTKQDKEQGKVFGHKIQKDRLTLALVVNTTCTYLQISMPKMLWEVIANKLCVVIRKPNGMEDIMCIWDLDDEPWCTFETSKAKGTFNYGQSYYSFP